MQLENQGQAKNGVAAMTKREGNKMAATSVLCYFGLEVRRNEMILGMVLFTTRVTGPEYH